MKLQSKNPYIKQALGVLEPLGLDNDLHPLKIRLNDAANYVARILDEAVEDPPLAEMLEHLGITEETPNGAAVKARLEAALAAPQADEALSNRLKIEAEIKADPSLTKKYIKELKKWAVEDIEAAAAD
jgi:hypothetical protein